jgi:hypothetical protein
MIPDDVPGFRQLARDVRPLPDESPNQEKCRPHIVLRQDFQQPQRMRIIWPVIISQR